MRRLTSCTAILGCLLLFIFISSAYAHDGEWGNQSDPCEFSVIGPTGEEDFLHEDAETYKGWAKIWFLNLCGDDWGDFHLKVVGKDAEHVDFVNDGVHEPQIWVYTAGIGLQKITDIEISISPDGEQLDMTFYDTPISKLSVGYIDVYTDNTSHYCDWFTIKAYPTAVPEPATIALLTLGGLVLFRKRR